MILTTPEPFHEFRRKGLGGSDIAAIMGKSPWQTPLDVYKRIKEGITLEASNEERKHWGKVLEEKILDRYESLNDVKGQRNPQIIHDGFEFIRGNSDLWIPHNKDLIEVKNVDTMYMRHWYVNGKWVIPAMYKFQVCHYASILNPDRIIFCVLFGGNKMVVIEYERNIKLEKALLTKAIQWWEKHIVANVAPAPSRVSDINNYVKINPNSTIEATLEIEEQAQKIKSLTNTVKELEKKKDGIKLFMGEHENLLDKNGEVIASFKEIKSMRVDTDKLKQDKMFDKYAREINYKRLRV